MKANMRMMITKERRKIDGSPLPLSLSLSLSLSFHIIERHLMLEISMIENAAAMLIPDSANATG